MKLSIGFILISAFFINCSSVDKEQVLFIAHSRVCDGHGADDVDPRLEKIDFSKYALFVHGGDVLCQTSKSKESLAYANNLFNLTSEKTLWVKGNHDLSATDYKLPHQWKKSVRSKTINKTQFIVLDYLLEEDIWNLSSEPFKDVPSDINQLVVFTHYFLPAYRHKELEEVSVNAANVHHCKADWCVKENNFMTEVYPKLIDFKSRGIEVTCVSGDFGVKRKTFSFIDSLGIKFLGNGLNDKTENDSILLFKNEGELFRPYFASLNSLL